MDLVYLIYQLISVLRGKENPKRFWERWVTKQIKRPSGKLIWLHAASVGESLSLLPLIENIIADNPKINILITSTTKTSTPTPTQTLTQTETPALTPLPTDTPNPTTTPTNSQTSSNTPTNSVTPSNSSTPDSTPTGTPTSTVTPTNSQTPTPDPTTTPTTTQTPVLLSKNIKIQLNRLEVGRQYKIDVVDTINQASEVRLFPSTQNITANSSEQNIAVRLDFSGSISLMNLSVKVTDNISGLVDHNTILVLTNNFQECY